MYLTPIQAENVAQVFGWKSTYVSIEGRWSEKTERTSKIDLKRPSLSLSHHSDTPFLLRQRPSALGMLARGKKRRRGKKKKGERGVRTRLQSPQAKGRALKFLHIAAICPPSKICSSPRFSSIRHLTLLLRGMSLQGEEVIMAISAASPASTLVTRRLLGLK